MKKTTNMLWSVLYPVILPIFAITPWWAFAKYVLKLNISGYKYMGYFLFLMLFIAGITISIWNRKVRDPEKEQKLIEKLFTGYWKIILFIICFQFILIILIGIFYSLAYDYTFTELFGIISACNGRS
ncbi:MAG: hypothetical protein ABIJ37_09235 [Pseudomonadota bacterium]